MPVVLLKQQVIEKGPLVIEVVEYIGAQWEGVRVNNESIPPGSREKKVFGMGAGMVRKG